MIIQGFFKNALWATATSSYDKLVLQDTKGVTWHRAFVAKDIKGFSTKVGLYLLLQDF